MCRSNTCFKGRLGALVCRMYYWHWAKVLNEKCQFVAKRAHGLQLHARFRPDVPFPDRWDGSLLPPVETVQPHAGKPAYERHHPFHGKASFGTLLTACCNSDCEFLFHFPPHDEWTRAKLSTEALRVMSVNISQRENYLKLYVSKETPHITGLLAGLLRAATAVHSEIQTLEDAEPRLTNLQRASRLLHRCISQTNRFMHKGFPEMASRLLDKPMVYR